MGIFILIGFLLIIALCGSIKNQFISVIIIIIGMILLFSPLVIKWLLNII